MASLQGQKGTQVRGPGTCQRQTKGEVEAADPGHRPLEVGPSEVMTTSP